MIIDARAPGPFLEEEFLKRDEDSILYLGNDHAGREMWLSSSQVRTHTFVAGTTGSGKTELLLGMMSNAISWGSGAMIVDGKGDMSLFAKLHVITTALGREEDLLVLNFMNPSSAKDGKLSNTINPLAKLPSDALIQMVVGMMEEADGEGAMWKGRAIAMMSAVIGALVWLRDEGMVDLTFSVLRDHCALRRIIDLADARMFPKMPHAIRKRVRAYLTSLPGYQEDKGYKQPQTTLDQHGYLEMQYTRLLGALADDYGHIFGTQHPEIDIEDVVLNRRILVVLLPTLEKSASEVSHLGRIIVSLIKDMMGKALRTGMEGDWERLIENRPTNADKPFLCIMDEVGHYISEGMAVMAAQARSLNFGMVFATQDMGAMRQANHRETTSILANTNTKIFLRSESLSGTEIDDCFSNFTSYEQKLDFRDGQVRNLKIRRTSDRMHWWDIASRIRSLVADNIVEEALVAHDEGIEAEKAKSVVELKHRLRYLREGEMFVISGGQGKFGRALHVPVTGHGHRLRLNNYFPVSSHVDSEIERDREARRIDDLKAAIDLHWSSPESYSERHPLPVADYFPRTRVFLPGAHGRLKLAVNAIRLAHGDIPAAAAEPTKAEVLKLDTGTIVDIGRKS